MKARLLYKEKLQFEDGSILELVLWELPNKTKDRPHGYKYRLYYCDNERHCIVRYDNETGKGDHKHIGDKEIEYLFVDKDTLLEDFYRDVMQYLKKRAKHE
ncbi:MAG: hypothetical protein A3F42_00875 [Gammaproteobacteria bacterium RIFCSPHIGHO2_12_FULL_37_34]|nr:MAG: hypothetical protein A3F42_00875 [Gammaproteobacteria bacterium RIFCSPHIGHO2_12_FULL_37_34]